MKAVAHRDRDLVDIDGLLATHPHLDVRRVRRWVRSFADALESPELYDDLQERLGRRPPESAARERHDPSLTAIALLRAYAGCKLFACTA